MKQAKLGIVGFGRIVELVHLPLIRRVPALQAAGVFDITAQRLALAEKRGFRAYDRLEDLLDSDVDAVLVATPPSSHSELAIEALRRGKHVMVEKPVAVRHDQAAEVMNAAREAGRIATVFHNRRLDPDFLLAKEAIASGMLGQVQFVERRCHRFGSGASFAVKSFDPEWRNKPEYGGGALLDWGVHLVDQLLQLNLGRVVQVQGLVRRLPWNRGEADDYAVARLTLDNGIVLTAETNFASLAPEPMWVIGGDRATLCVVSETEAYLREPGRPARALETGPVSRFAAAALYEAFANAILEGGEPFVPMEEAVGAMKVLDLVERSSREGRTEWM
ncbi:oxidoreductase [Cohnella xylanilytica]|uniref:Gfo/Idh/MocA family protein n=1 Tax=Cohnella xylanilytica TaxID=557555 RepID=UPI001B03A1A6|nr:Gfo/Idh/MocA family oxidoreductase [Cohnella xylanilytica]GIO13724.1 oxidoreductase [Cohnella xylanilytica]